MHWLSSSKTGKARASIRKHWQGKLMNNEEETKEYTSTLSIDLPHKPGILGKVSTIIGLNKANIINVELKKPSDLKDIYKILNDCPGVVVEDNPSKNKYPMPIYSEGKNDVFVGRIRNDISKKNAYNMWIVADNLRKGAATNAIQIAEYIKDNF